MTSPLDGVRSAASVRAESSETMLTVVMGDDSPLPKKRPVTAPPSSSSPRQYSHVEVETAEKHRPDCARGSHKPHQGENRHPEAVVAARASLISKERIKVDYGEDAGDDVSRTTMQPEQEACKSGVGETPSTKAGKVRIVEASGSPAALPPANKFTLSDPHVMIRPSRKGTRLNDPDEFHKAAAAVAVRDEVDATPLLPLRRTSSGTSALKSIWGRLHQLGQLKLRVSFGDLMDDDFSKASMHISPRTALKKQHSFRSLTSAHSRYLRETLGEGESLGPFPSSSSRDTPGRSPHLGHQDSAYSPIVAELDCKSCDADDYVIRSFSTDTRSEELNAISITSNAKEADPKHHAAISFLEAVKGDNVAIGSSASIHRAEEKPDSDPAKKSNAVKGDSRSMESFSRGARGPGVGGSHEGSRHTSPKTRVYTTDSVATSGDVWDFASKLLKQDPCWLTKPMMEELMERRRVERRGVKAMEAEGAAEAAEGAAKAGEGAVAAERVGRAADRAGRAEERAQRRHRKKQQRTERSPAAARHEAHQQRQERQEQRVEDPCWKSAPGLFSVPSYHETPALTKLRHHTRRRQQEGVEASNMNESELSGSTGSSRASSSESFRTPKHMHSRPSKILLTGSSQSQTEVVAWVPAPTPLLPYGPSASTSQSRRMERSREKSRASSREGSRPRSRPPSNDAEEQQTAAGDETPLPVSRGGITGGRRNAICAPMPEALFAVVAAAAANRSTPSNHSAGDVALSALWRQRSPSIREEIPRSAASTASVAPAAAAAVAAAVAAAAARGSDSEPRLPARILLATPRAASTVGQELVTVPHIPQEDPRVCLDSMAATKETRATVRKNTKKVQREERVRLLEKERGGTESSDENDMLPDKESAHSDSSSSEHDSKLLSTHKAIVIPVLSTNKMPVVDEMASQEDSAVKAAAAEAAAAEAATEVSEAAEAEAEKRGAEAAPSSPQLSIFLEHNREQHLQPPDMSPRISPGEFPPRPRPPSPPPATPNAPDAIPLRRSVSPLPSSPSPPGDTAVPVAAPQQEVGRNTRSNGKSPKSGAQSEAKESL